MRESKSEASDRLRREGRWNEASLFKDETIRQLRLGGMKRSEATELGWEAMAEKFPPVETAQTATESPSAALKLFESDLLPPPAIDGESGDFVDSVQWAFDRLDCEVAPTDAPSPGAWSLLKWARSSRDDFYKAIVPRALDIQAKRGSERDIDSEALEEVEDCESIEQLLSGLFNK